MSKAWMPFYWGDFLADTMHLSPPQIGIYVLLIGHYWTKGGLPGSEEQCICIARAMHEHDRQSLHQILTEFFHFDGESYKHGRLDKELEKASDAYERRANAAKRRWDKADDAVGSCNAPAIDDALHEQSQSQSHTDPIGSVKDLGEPKKSDVGKPSKQPAKQKIEFPDWIPSEEWSGFVEMRKRKGKPLTDRAIALAIGELEKLRAQGQDPVAVLNQSIFNSWQGLFAVKPDRGQTPQRQNIHDRRAATIAGLTGRSTTGEQDSGRIIDITPTERTGPDPMD